MSAYRFMSRTVYACLAPVGVGMLYIVSLATLLFLFFGCSFIAAVLITAAAVPLLGAVLVTSPHSLALCRRLLRAAPTPSAEQLDALVHALACASPEYVPFQPLTQLRRLTDEQLCQGWRASYLALRTQPPGAEMIETVEERQRYLDELERRNPGGLTAWLASGAGAAGNPLPYLVQNPGGAAAIDWDELTRGQDR
jgi:hypothetical protein